MDGGTVLRWALVLVVLLCGAGLTYAVWQLESSLQERPGEPWGRER